MTDPVQVTEIEAVTAVHDAFYAAVELADAAAMDAMWDAGDDVSCVHPGWTPLHGRSKVLRSWAAIMAGTQELHFLLTDVRVRVDGDVAVVTCTENILTGEVVEGGRVGGIGAAAATNVLRRRDGVWRLLAHHASPLPAEGPDD